MATLAEKIKKEQKKKSLSPNWWYVNGYKVMRIIFWPIWLCLVFGEWYERKTYEALRFSKEKCKKYLDKIMPEMVARHEEDSVDILISDDGDIGGIEFSDFCHSQKKKISKFFKKFHHEFKDYILKEYEIDGYAKMLLDSEARWNEAKDRFGWLWTSMYSDTKGVVFYPKEI